MFLEMAELKKAKLHMIYIVEICSGWDLSACSHIARIFLFIQTVQSIQTEAYGSFVQQMHHTVTSKCSRIFTLRSTGTLCKGNMVLCIFHIISIHLMFQLFWCGNGNSLKWQKKKNQILMTVLLQILMTVELISTVQFLSSAGAVTEDKQENF